MLQPRSPIMEIKLVFPTGAFHSNPPDCAGERCTAFNFGRRRGEIVTASCLKCALKRLCDVRQFILRLDQ